MALNFFQYLFRSIAKKITYSYEGSRPDQCAGVSEKSKMSVTQLGCSRHNCGQMTNARDKISYQKGPGAVPIEPGVNSFYPLWGNMKEPQMVKDKQSDSSA
jgi:hypothetical protein